MKRLLFVVLMMVYSVSWAEWELCAIDGEGDEMLSVYCDKRTIRKNGVISRMWDLYDYSSMQTEAGSNGYMSTKALWAYNCREETKALISVIQYSGAMGGGVVVESVTCLLYTSDAADE